MNLLDSTVTGQWGSGLRNLCNPSKPELCDCGYRGEWEHRFVYVWQHEPGRRRPDWLIRKDIAAGRPPRVDNEGRWCIAGWDERCPGCGDIERFDDAGNVVRRFAEQAKVVIHAEFGR